MVPAASGAFVVQLRRHRRLYPAGPNLVCEVIGARWSNVVERTEPRLDDCARTAAVARPRKTRSIRDVFAGASGQR
jgi:hypothetical protein